MSSLEKENVKINSSVLQQQVCKCEIVTNRRGSIIIYFSNVYESKLVIQCITSLLG